MMRLNVRHPLLIGPVATGIVIVAIALVAPRVSPPRDRASQTESVSIARNVLVAPKLMVRVPNASNAAPAPTPAAEGGTLAPLIARKASIALIATNVDAAVAASQRIARGSSGDVFSLQTSNDGSANASADMTLRVPAAEFDASMAAVVKLGTVTSRTIEAEDVTADVVDSSAKLRNLRRTENDIRAIMDRSGSVGQVMDAENRLSEVREQIETLESELRAMRGRVAYSTLDVHIVAEAVTPQPDRSASAQLRNAATAAMHHLADVTVAIIAGVIWIAVFAPYALLAFGAAWATALFLRKRYAVRR